MTDATQLTQQKQNKTQLTQQNNKARIKRPSKGRAQEGCGYPEENRACDADDGRRRSGTAISAPETHAQGDNYVGMGGAGALMQTPGIFGLRGAFSSGDVGAGGSAAFDWSLVNFSGLTAVRGESLRGCVFGH